MEDKRILYVSSEVVPYLAENEVSMMSYEMPKMINDQGGQIRIFMPRYGNINERRHQLHEVIRLIRNEFGGKRYGYAFDY
jgi:starch synthase